MTLNECDWPDKMQHGLHQRWNAFKSTLRVIQIHVGRVRLLVITLVLLSLVSLPVLAQTPGCVPNTANYPCVYVANQAGEGIAGLISVLNATGNTIIANVPLPNTATFVNGIAVTRDNQFVLVPTSDANQGVSYISVVSTATNTITATNIGLQGVPLQIAVRPDNAQAWIAESGSVEEGSVNTIEVFDIPSQTITGNLESLSLAAPTAIAFSPDSQFAYVADTCTVGGVAEACLEKISTAPRPTLVTIDIAGTLGNEPSSIAVTPDGSLACMSVLDANLNLEVACIDTSNDTAVILPATNQNATPSDFGMAIALGGTLFVAAPATNVNTPDGSTPLSQVYLFNPAGDTYLGTLTIGVGSTGDAGSGPIGVSASPDGTAVYVTDNDIDGVSVIAPATNTLVGTMTLPSGSLPRGVAAMPSIAPSITTEPASQSVNYGSTATLSVAAGGTAPLAYQWYVGQSGDTTNPVAGATTDSYTTPALTATTSYWVAISNIVAGGLLDSATATVTVTPVAPTITTQPASQSISPGLTATLTVAATGSPTLAYQWYQGQSGDTTIPLGGATGTTYTTPPLTAMTSYWVQVSNAVGPVNSSTATITVLTTPSQGCLPNTSTYPCVYVAIQSQTMSAPSQVSVINAATNAVIGSIPLGVAASVFNVAGIAATPDNQFVLVPSSNFNQSVNSLTVISTASNTINGSNIVLQGVPSQIAVSPDNTQAWVAETAAETQNSIDAVEIFDIASQTITGNIPLNFPSSVAFTPDAKYAYVANSCPLGGSAIACAVKISTTAPYATVATIEIDGSRGGYPAAISVTPDGSLACMSTLDGNAMLQLSCIDTTTDAVVTPSVATMQGAQASTFGFAVTPGGTLYAAAPTAPELIFNGASLSQVFLFSPSQNAYLGAISIPVGNTGDAGSEPNGVAVSADGTSVYVTAEALDNVTILSPTSGATVATVPLPAPLYAPQGVAAMPSIPPSITTQPASQTINSGLTATLTVAVGGTAPFTYQWYAGQSGDTTNPVTGATTASFTTPALTTTTSYWVAVSNIVAGGVADSTTATVTVVAVAPTITTQPASQIIASGATATLNVVASGTPPLTYQWYQGQSGDTTNPLAGATGNTFTTPALTATASYWVAVGNSAATVDSSTATITVNPAGVGQGCIPNTADYPCVYVASIVGGEDEPVEISVINATTKAMIGNPIALPAQATSVAGIAATPDNQFILVPTSGFGTLNQVSNLAVIATGTNSVSASGIALQGIASQIAVSPDNTQAWIAESNSDSLPNSVNAIEVFDIATQKITAAIPLNVPSAVAFTPDSKFAYVADSCSVAGALEACAEKIATTAPYATAATIAIAGSQGDQPASIAVTPDGSLACMSVLDGNFNLQLACIDTTTNVVVTPPIATLQGALPSDFGFAVTPAGVLYAAAPTAPAADDSVPLSQVFLFNPSSNTYLGAITIPVGTTGDAGSEPNGIAASADGTAVYVSNQALDNVSVVNAASGSIVATLPLANNFSPQGVAAMPSIPPSITTEPASQTINYGQPATMTVTATGTAPLTYQWYLGQSGNTTAPITGATTNTYTTPALTATASYWVAVGNVVAQGGLQSTSATITVPPFTPPAIVTQPASQTITAGQTATLSVTATGTPPLSYQWYQGISGNTAAPIAQATNPTYTTPALNATTSYWVLVSTQAGPGSVASATATITTTPVAPAITTQPASQTIPGGQVATLSVVATGTPPLTYQWYQGTSGDTSAPIAGATAASYTTPLLIASASYWVLVSNSAGKVDSVTATITVTPVAPGIATQPASQTINFNQVATLSVVASGTGPFTYQWYLGQSGVATNPIAGATAAIYVTPPLAASTSYWVSVTNAFGSVNSATAVISVNQSPTCTLAVQGSGSMTANFAEVFTVVATATCTDPQSSTLSTSIDWGDGSPPAVGPGGTLTASHTYPAPLQSSYTNTVTSTDALGLQGKATYSTTLISTSQIPGIFAGQTAYFTLPLTSENPGPPIQVTFNCTTATDPNGNVVDASSIGLECVSKQPVVTLSATPQNVTLGIETLGTAQASAKTNPGRSVLLACACLLLPGLLLLGGRKNKKANSRRGRFAGWGAWILLLGFIVQLNGCTTGGFTPPSTTPPPSSTPAVNYQVTIVDNPVDPTNTSGFVQISLIVPITISPTQ
jgi:DNA-binding beta-propeller fold protein YncE